LKPCFWLPAQHLSRIAAAIDPDDADRVEIPQASPMDAETMRGLPTPEAARAVPLSYSERHDAPASPCCLTRLVFLRAGRWSGGASLRSFMIEENADLKPWTLIRPR
jgi:hypothetical protein